MISVTRPLKAPDGAKEKPDKTIDDIVAMASLTRDKDGAVFGSETETSSDLETEGEKHDGVNPPEEEDSHEDMREGCS